MRYPKAAAAWSRVAISPCGVRGMSSPDGDPFFEELQGVYDEIGEALPLGSALPRAQELDDERADIEASGLFDVVEVRQYDWDAVYYAEGYIDLLNTFSGTSRGGLATRTALRRDSSQPTPRTDGLLRRHWGGVLDVARVGPA
jgi:hypothetical protein